MLLTPALRRLALPVLLVLSSMASIACAGQQGGILKYTDRSDIREGPGLLTGEQGAFTLTLGGGDSTAGAREAAGTDVSFQEFREFKRSGDGDVPDEEALRKEYEEFQRWKEWRDYQDRQKSRNDEQ